MTAPIDIGKALIARGKAEYALDLLRRPLYHDGAPRKTWEQLGPVEQWSWTRAAKEGIRG